MRRDLDLRPAASCTHEVPAPHSAQSSAPFLPLHCTALAIAAVLGHRFPAGAYAANPTGGANRIAPFAIAVPSLEEEVGVEKSLGRRSGCGGGGGGGGS